MARDVVLEDVGGHVLLFLGGKTADDVVVHDVAHEAVGVVQHERAQGVYAEQLAVLVGDVHVVHRRVILGQRAQHFDGVGHGGGFRHGDELGGHHAAGGAVLVAEQPADLRSVFHAHEAQKGLGLLVGKAAHNVGGVVRIHVADELGGPRVGQVVDELGLVLVFHLGDGLGGAAVVQMGEHAGALLGVQLLQDVGHVGGMQLVQAAMGHRQLHLGQVAVEQIHVVPGDELLVHLLVEELRHVHDGLFQQRMQPAQDATHAHLGTEQAATACRIARA